MSWLTLLIAAALAVALAALGVWLLGPLSDMLLWLGGEEDATGPPDAAEPTGRTPVGQ